MVRRVAISLAALLAAAAPAHAAKISTTERSSLQRYAADTWRSFDLMVDARTGLPADNVSAGGTRSGYTSPTNIGAYLWSTVGAHETGLIGRSEAVRRAGRTLRTLASMERGPAGQFFNWYDPATGARLTTWPPDGSPLLPFLSSVDNAWLATALHIVETALPDLRAQAHAIVAPMDFGLYYDPAVGQLRGGARTEQPPTCDFDWTETQPVGVTRTYLGVDVFEGAYEYRGMRVVPSWGGSMSEALMPALFVPEARWSPRSWGVNHPLYVRAQMEHGLDEAGYGARQPRQPALALRDLRQRRLLRRGQRRQRPGRALLPRSRPGHGDGRRGRRPDRQPPAQALRPGRRGAGATAAGDGAVQLGLRVNRPTKRSSSLARAASS
jgi:hypothetical protein